ncbi:CBS domain-containing protein [Halococcoides cellulosivorans]|uniref:CBS domain-containing protein n=1 Tax=Halococcoides cellulosivorans TaxID=1679096 RepID=A0A2R4X465_9EURY|nr:CBS domain-containing protein [Halococcoides cellulosivorans]AWB28591.1 CBS domain-containing protein [Halococcoides cellulosivorans]
MPVSDLMRSNVVTASPESSIDSLAESMRDHGVGSVVIEDDSTVSGIVTDRDLVTRVMAENADWSTLQASDVMTPDLQTVSADTGIAELVETLSEEGVRRMPVVENDDLVGIVALDDVFALLAVEQDRLANVVEAESPVFE